MLRGKLLMALFLLGGGLYACGRDHRDRELTNDSEAPEDEVSTGGMGGGSGGTPEILPEYEGIPIPGTFEAEAFARALESDDTQEGDAECVNSAYPFVDVGMSDAARGGCSIGYTLAGEWLEYDIAVPEDGAYDFTLSLATQLDSRSVSISIDGVSRGTITLPATDWDDFQELTLEGIGLLEGTRIFRVTFDTGGTNFDYVDVAPASACIPACNNKTCGDDFCGGTCGACEEDQTCNSANLCVGPFRKPVAEHGALRVEGIQILDENDDPVQLRGVSSQWLNWEQNYASSPENKVFMRDEWGLDVLRVANGVENNNGYAVPTVQEERLQLVKDIIDQAIEAEIYVIVDWHTHSIDYKDLAIEFFDEIAAEYGDTPNVIYEVFNEPIGADPEDFWASELKPYHEELVAAIRAHDEDNLIVLGTPRWDQEVGVAAADPVEGDNLLYALHFYSCTHTSWLRSRAEAALLAGLPLFVTEWGSTHADGGTNENPGVCLTEAQAWHTLLDEYGVGSTAWKLTSDTDDSSILKGAPFTGPWGDDQLTEHGTFVREILQRP